VAEVIGSTRIERPGNPPIAFSIAYDASRIDAKKRYAVRARIVAGGRLLFTTDTHYTMGNEVALTLRRVGAAATLENTYWKLTHFGSEPITVVQRL
jgi:uncharacterized lipoprotein YbaY